MKPLSEMLREVEGNNHIISGGFHWVLKKDYEKLRQVAIELAKACEAIGWCICVKVPCECDDETTAEQGIARAKDIIGGKDE